MLLPVPSDFISLFVDIRHYFWLYEVMTSQAPYNFYDNSTGDESLFIVIYWNSTPQGKLLYIIFLMKLVFLFRVTF